MASTIGNAGLNRVVALAMSIPVLASCYRYVPAELDAVPPGGEVRVYLSRTATARLPEEIRSRGPYVAGSLVGRETQNLMLRVPITAQLESLREIRLRQDVIIPEQEVVELRRREFDTVRTGLLLAVGAGAAAAIVATIMDGSGSDRGAEEIPEVSLIPLFVLRVR